MIVIRSSQTKVFLMILCSILIAVSLLFFYLYARDKKPQIPLKTGMQEYYSEKTEMGYYVYIPHEYKNNQKTKYPLIIHLHGSGTAGNGKSELLKVKVHGLKALIYNVSSKKCCVLAPQAKFKWDSGDLDELLDEITSVYPIDVERIYLTGVSMGGHGTWSYAVNGRYKLAAIVPICGYYFFYDEQLAKVKDLPIWIFHGKKDASVSVSNTYDIIEKLENINHKLRYTIYENGSHVIWNEVYSTPELYEWLFAQVKPNSDIGFQSKAPKK